MFGQRLRLARKKAGLSMQGLADRTSPRITAQAISKYEADKMNPSSSVLVGLSKALGVSLDFLMGGQVEELVVPAVGRPHDLADVGTRRLGVRDAPGLEEAHLVAPSGQFEGRGGAEFTAADHDDPRRQRPSFPLPPRTGDAA